MLKCSCLYYPPLITLSDFTPPSQDSDQHIKLTPSPEIPGGPRDSPCYRMVIFQILSAIACFANPIALHAYPSEFPQHSTAHAMLNL